ncbi:MAG: hypothetical protein WCW31_04680 [Patescibacteria group bacterium]|jgi:hypothetical protein
MHEGLKQLEEHGTNENKRALEALSKIENALGNSGIKPRIAVFEHNSFEHFTHDLMLDLEFCWFYDLMARLVVCSLEFRDNSELEIVYSIYIRLDLPSDRWYLGYKRHESKYDSPNARKIALRAFKFTRPPAVFQIPEDRIFSEIFPKLIQIFREWLFNS